MLTDYPDLRRVEPGQKWDEGRYAVNKGFSYGSQLYINYIFLYKNHENVDSFLPDNTLKESLHTLVEKYYPPLAGWFETTDDVISVVWNKNDMTLPSFTSTTIDASYSKLLEMTDAYDSTLLPDSPSGTITKEMHRNPFCLVKVTRAKDNSALSLGISISHVLTDGGSFCRFLNNWALLCKQMLRGIPSNEATVLYTPIFGSLELNRGVENSTEYLKHNEFVRIPIDTTKQDQNPVIPPIKDVLHKLVVSAQQKNNLREKAHNIGVSFNSILCAMMWKEINVLRLLYKPEIAKEPSVYSLNVDVRKKLGVPGEYCSSEIYIAYADSYTVEEVANMSLTDAAMIISDTVKKATSEYIVGVFHKLWMLEKENRQDVKDGKPCGMVLPQFAIPGPSKIISSSNDNFPMYEADFGTGIPVYSHPPVAPFDGLLIIWPTPPNDAGESGLELHIGLSKEIDVSKSEELRKFICK